MEQKITFAKIKKKNEHAWAFFQKGFLDEALKISQEILEKFPSNTESIYISGLVYLKDGQIKKAIEYLSAAHKNSTAHFELISNLGFAYHELGEIDLAEKFYRKALAINPKYLNAYYNLHAIQIDQGKINESIDTLKKIIALNPIDYDAYFMIGLLNDYLGNINQSRQYFMQIQDKSSLIDSRIEAWNYLRKTCNNKFKLTGSSIETFKIALNASNIDGLILEFGVRHGNSINQLANITNRPIYGFDSFEGLKEAWHYEPEGSYSTKGILPEVQKNVTLQKGWFDETLPTFLEEHKELIKLINIDCDTYESTKIVFDLLGHRIHSGSIIIFDEYIGNQYWKDDEFKAFQEAANENEWDYQYLACSFFTKQVVVKIL
jgi:predicted negative regulator of RcsB-dependent stress response